MRPDGTDDRGRLGMGISSTGSDAAIATGAHGHRRGNRNSAQRPHLLHPPQ